MGRYKFRRLTLCILLVSVGLWGCDELSQLALVGKPTPTLWLTNTSEYSPTFTLPRTPTTFLTPIFTPMGGGAHIAFTLLAGDKWHICTIDVDGSNMTRLTSGTTNNWYPTWSPDGSRIAFISDADAQTACSSPSCNTDIFVIDADGHNLTQLTRSPSHEKTPDWSPDGLHIAFSSNRDDPDPSTCEFECNFEIYVMNSDGSDVIRLTDDTADDTEPAWSPDGSRIAYTTMRNGTPQINVMNVDGSNIKRLTVGPDTHYSPTWSPNGLRILMASEADDGRRRSASICMMDSDGFNLLCLSNEWLRYPAWSPDGKLIAFVADGNILLMDTDGSHVRRITDFESGSSPCYLDWTH